MKVLFVDACVRKDSRTRTLCQAYMDACWGGQGTEIKKRELAQEPLVPLNRERLEQRDRDIAAGRFSLEKYRYAREFAEAEEILVGAPYWDCSFPALLKLYLEQVCVNGIVFSYGEDGRPVKTNACRKLVYITTAGGYLGENSSLESYWKELCGLFCIPQLQIYKGEGLDIQGNDPQNILENCKNAMINVSR